MKKSPFILVVLICLSIANLNAQDSKQSLNSTYPFRIGDYAALILPELLRVGKFEASTIAIYDPASETIEVQIFGGLSTAEGAKESIQEAFRLIRSSHIPYVARRFALTMTDNDYAISYYDRIAGNKLVIQYAKGQYTLPK